MTSLLEDYLTDWNVCVSINNHVCSLTVRYHTCWLQILATNPLNYDESVLSIKCLGQDIEEFCSYPFAFNEYES